MGCPKHTVSYRRPRSSVAVLNAAEYSERIEALLLDGLRLFRLQVLGRSVLLKPNLVEDLPGPVNTNSTLIGAAARCFLRLGAVRVVIGEGPGHQRDTELVVQAAGLQSLLAEASRKLEGGGAWPRSIHVVEVTYTPGFLSRSQDLVVIAHHVGVPDRGGAKAAPKSGTIGF
jgi:hypothetical protein